MKTHWAKMRHVVEGNTAIQKNAKLYLPQLTEQTPDEYKAYHERGVFFNATGRVVDTMKGMIFRKPAFAEVKPIQDIADNIDLAGMGLNAVCESTIQQQFEVSRCGVL